MCKEKELTEAAYRYYVDEACIEDIAKQLHRSYNYTRLIIKKYRGAFRDAIIMHWLGSLMLIFCHSILHPYRAALNSSGFRLRSVRSCLHALIEVNKIV